MNLIKCKCMINTSKVTPCPTNFLKSNCEHICSLVDINFEITVHSTVNQPELILAGKLGFQLISNWKQLCITNSVHQMISTVKQNTWFEVEVKKRLTKEWPNFIARWRLRAPDWCVRSLSRFWPLFSANISLSFPQFFSLKKFRRFLLIVWVFMSWFVARGLKFVIQFISNWYQMWNSLISKLISTKEQNLMSTIFQLSSIEIKSWLCFQHAFKSLSAWFQKVCRVTLLWILYEKHLQAFVPI